MIPGLAALRGYRAWLAGDLLAGVTVAAYLVPQVMAYAGLAGLPPVTGLWAAFPALIAYALFGSSKSVSMGPEATTALMTVVAIRPLAGGDPARFAGLASTLALLVGLMAVAAWLLRLGFFADLLSRPVLVGYLAGVALIMIADQLQNVTGVPVTGQVFAAQIGSFARGLGHVRPEVLAISLSVLAFLLLLRWRWPRLPGPLLAVLLATAAVALIHPAGAGVVGPVPARLPGVALPTLDPGVLRELLLPAFTVLIVGFSDDVVTARSFAGRDEQIVANRELLALGVANVGASLVHGFPVSSSGTRTAIAIAAGRKTQVYSLATAASVLVVLLVARPVLARFPTAALGGIVIFAALRLIDVQAFRRLFAFRRTELLIAVAACLGVLALDILYGVLVAIALSVADLLVRVARPHDAIQGIVPGLAGMHDVDDYPDARPSPAWWCTATTRRCSSPTRRTSGAAPWPRRTGRRARCAGSCSTSRPTSRSTSPRWRRWRRCARTSPAAVPCSPSPGSSRTCWPGWRPSAWPPRSARSCCSRPCPPPCRPTRTGRKTRRPVTKARDRGRSR